MKNFMERAIAGEIEDLEEALDDAIDEWHALPDDGAVGDTIHLYLGMTWQEYARWVKDPKSLEDIINKRRS